MFNTDCTQLHFIKAIRQSWKIQKYSYKNVSRPDYGFLYVTSGKIILQFNEEELQLISGDIVFLPKSCNYEAIFDNSDGPVEDYLINFDIPENDHFSQYTIPTHIISDTSSVLLHHFKEVRDAYINRKNPYFLNSLFYMCIYNILSHQNQAQNTEEIELEKAALMLLEDADLSIIDVAQSLHMSRSTFQKKFKIKYGMSPIDYKCKNRIEKAKSLLETTDIPVKEIANELMFYDVAYFYKVFDKYCHTTPWQYRNNIGQKL